jgi:hypothetical protein
MKNLVLICGTYPFDKGESFLGNEIPFLIGFNKIYVCPCSCEKLSKARLINNSSVKVVGIINKSSLASKIVKVFRYLKCFFNPLVIEEIQFLITNRKLNKHTLKELLSFVSVAENCIKKLKRQLQDDLNNESNDIILYTLKPIKLFQRKILIKEHLITPI